jgi:hypothetical protein
MPPKITSCGMSWEKVGNGYSLSLALESWLAYLNSQMASLKTIKTRLAQFLTPEFTIVNEDVKNWV